MQILTTLWIRMLTMESSRMSLNVQWRAVLLRQFYELDIDIPMDFEASKSLKFV